MLDNSDGIPSAARLVAVADLYDALRQNRPYRVSWPSERARSEIQLHRESLLDCAAVDVFLSIPSAEREA